MGSVRVGDRPSWWLGEAAERLYDECREASLRGDEQESVRLLVEASKAAKAYTQVQHRLREDE